MGALLNKRQCTRYS